MTQFMQSYENNENADIVRIFLIRHGQTDHNVKKILQGHKDIPLNVNGIKQSRRLGEYMKEQNIKFDKVYSSDLVRCQETIREVLNLSGQDTITVELNSDLRERFMGPIEGMHVNDAEKYADKHGKGSFRDFGENPTIFLERLQRGIDSSIRDSIASDNKNIAVVSHGGAIRAIMGWLQPNVEDVTKMIVFNTSVTVIDYVISEKVFNIRVIGNTSHLGEGTFMVSDLRLR